MGPEFGLDGYPRDPIYRGIMNALRLLTAIALAGLAYVIWALTPWFPWK
jgi:hypothetical protein